jgi:hypothetical protein
MERMCRGGGRNIWPSSRFMMTRAANQASQGATERPAGELGSSRGTAVRSGSFLAWDGDYTFDSPTQKPSIIVTKRP